MKIFKILSLLIIGTLSFISCNDDDDNNTTTTPITGSSIVVEVTKFNLTEDVSTTDFETRDAEIEGDFTSQQPGFLKRMSGVDADGKYVVVVFWDTLADADASISAFQEDTTVADYFQMIDGNTFGVERYTTFAIPDINFTLTDNNVIEVTTFNLNDDVDVNAFEARDAEIEGDFTSQQTGFIERTSGDDGNGKYAVVVFWDSLADADASIAAFQEDATVADYFQMIDGSTFGVERFTKF